MKEDESKSVSEVVADRRDARDRRKFSERRGREVPVALDRRRRDRRTAERRRQIDPTTCERDYDEDELEFMKAMEVYKRGFVRPFPTWSEVLEVAKSLGYRKSAEPTAIARKRAKTSAEPDRL